MDTHSGTATQEDSRTFLFSEVSEVTRKQNLSVIHTTKV